MIEVEELAFVGTVHDEFDQDQTGSSSSFELNPPRGLRAGFPPPLSQFDPISLQDMEQLALLDRTDTKYVISARQLHAALEGMAQHYRVLEIQGNRLNRYRTVYFDTDDLALYMSHHSGRRVRYKVRSREYVDTSQSFLEIKWKAKRDRTVKDRMRTTHLVTRWVPGETTLMESRLPAEAKYLEPQLANEFYRATLVSNHDKERVTLDFALRFHGSGRTVLLSGISVVEVKQDGLNRNSPFIQQMRAAGIRPSGFSKYCVGVTLIYQDVKHNRFKPSLRLIDSLMRGDEDA